ncbi:MAG: ChbG/HpnK family deacetylase [Candidatus Gastranaerophilales bacterium]|nr:ChbG/HpnK family deacetylase [Candidatus Gastranaerophilales bacterium]
MKIIINADDFGMSRTVNQAIVEGYNNGILTSTCIMANMPSFEDAVRKLKDIDGIGLGVHLNIIEHKSILKTREKNSKLYDKDGKFNNGFLKMIIKSFDEDFMFEVEQEFRAQIEAVLEYAKPDHLDSHVHTHAIPKIFELVCKLAKEYNIPCVRTQFEHVYLCKNRNFFFNKNYYINLIKICILNFFTLINRRTLKKYGLKSNNCVIGVGYTGMMDDNTIKGGVERVKNSDEVLEVICHPDKNENRPSNIKEYNAVTNENLKEYINTYNKISYKAL